MLTTRLSRYQDGAFLQHVLAESMANVIEENAQSLPKDESGRLFWEGHEAQFAEKSDPSIRPLIVQYDGTGIGRIRIIKKKDVWNLAGIQLLPQYQGRGFGSQLIQDMQKQAQQENCKITLSVDIVNVRATNLYHRLGFNITGQKNNQHLMEWSV